MESETTDGPGGTAVSQDVDTQQTVSDHIYVFRHILPAFAKTEIRHNFPTIIFVSSCQFNTACTVGS